jgi:DNA-binding transcriptional regulator YiaG
VKPKELREIREKLGLTQKALAEILGLSGYIPVSHYESGFRNPSTLIQALMRIFDEWPDKKSLELREALRLKGAQIKKRSRKDA